jgi:hypothetical protein
MVTAASDSKDVARVVKALANGLRSATDIADTTDLPADRVRVALDWLAATDHVTESLVKRETLWRLSDNGQDILKGINAAYRKRRERILVRIERRRSRER